MASAPPSNASLASGATLAGAVLEARDLGATRAFYDPIFRHTRGSWEEQGGALLFRVDGQEMQFVRRGRPRASGETAQHVGFRLPAARARAAADELRAAGFGVDWWHEDGPGERDLQPYLLDPSGNRVQIILSEADGSLLDHVALEVVDLDYAESVYRDGLGGQLEAYPGWTTDHGPEIKAWLAGDDPCAPWTRYSRFSFRSRTDEGHITPQLFLRFGEGRLALFLARAHHQEPPEEVVKGTPRVVLTCPSLASEVAEHLAGPARAQVSKHFRGRTIRFTVEGSSIFLRDPGGNYLELRCGN